MSEARADSPCVRKCTLDREDVCLGCGRRLEDILGWTKASSAQRLEILASSAERLRMRELRWG